MKQLLEMTASVYADGYTWEVGQDRDGVATVSYLVGYPPRAEN
jgi:hypothetical protein